MSMIDLTTTISDIPRRRDRESRNTYSALDDISGNVGNYESDEDSFLVNRGMFPTKMVFIVTGSYQDVVRRSFEANADDNSIRKLDELVNSNQNAPDILSLAGASNDIIRPSATIDKRINIIHGWDEPRCRIYLEFKRPMGAGSTLTYMYTGFTDYMGVSESGNIDPEMTIHITGASVVRTEIQGDYGFKSSTVQRDNAIVVADFHYEDRSMDNIRRHGQYGRQKEYIMDPVHVAMQKYAIDSFQDSDVMGNKLIPAQSEVGKDAKTVNRAYNIPSFYLSKLINTRRATKYDDELHDTSSSLYDYQYNKTNREISALRSSYIHEDPLANLYEDHGFTSSAKLVMEDLTELFPQLLDDSICTVIFPEGLRQMGRGSFESNVRAVGQETLDSDNWTGANQETIVATLISQQITNIMMSEFIASIRFTVTNESVSLYDDGYIWIFGDERRSRRDNRSSVMFFSNLPDQAARTRLESFKIKMSRIILDSVTMNGTIGIHLMVDCDVQGECTIYISLDGGHEYKFIMPTFANAMSSSLLTTDTSHFEDFTLDVFNVVDSVI